MSKPFENFDFTGFWDEDGYYEREYTDDPLTNEKIVAVEKDLGYKLPEAYLELAKRKNGGAPKKTNHRTSAPTSWAEDHIAITGIYSIGNAKPYSIVRRVQQRVLDGRMGLPPIGVYFADCPSAGHDMICLDYRDCGPAGEPTVVHVDQESNYRVTFVAENFETFIRGLEDDEAFDAT